jgi:polysaccharide export outer membrane protein
MTVIVAAMMLGMLLSRPTVYVVAEAGHEPQAEHHENIVNKVLPTDGTRHSAPASTAEAAPPNTDSNYRIGAEDVIHIDVWKETDLSATVPVRADGKISVPLLDDVQASGLTPIELSTSLREQLKKFVTDPKITVIVTQMNSRKAYVMGTVNRQGMVRLLSNLTVLQAISAAGGLAPFAKSKKIYVLRSQDGAQRRLPFNYDAVIHGNHPEENIVLQPGDTVIVP